MESSTRMPVVSGKDLAKILRKNGFVEVRSKGSHVRYRKSAGPYTWNVTLPSHEQIKKGTLQGILNQAGFTKSELVQLLYA